MNPELRAGRFTSSQIYKLVKQGRGKESLFSAPGLTYIKEKKLERLFKSNLDSNSYSKAMAWGNFMEAYLFTEKLGTEYKISSNTTIIHPDDYLGDYWAGSCDFEIMGDEPAISEAKCYQKKKFGLYVLALERKDTEYLKNEFPEEYWQIVSNAILHDVDYGEAVAFMPYIDEMEKAASYAEDPIWIDQYLGGDMWKYRFIYEENPRELPTLDKGGYFKDVNKFRFKVPTEDKNFLIERVELAIEELEKVEL